MDLVDLESFFECVASSVVQLSVHVFDLRYWRQSASVKVLSLEGMLVSVGSGCVERQTLTMARNVHLGGRRRGSGSLQAASNRARSRWNPTTLEWSKKMLRLQHCVGHQLQAYKQTYERGLTNAPVNSEV